MADSKIERAITREEPPYKRRSPLWAKQKEIRQLIESGYSYRQILERLDLKVSISRLAAFARDVLGITSRTVGEKARAKTGQRPEEKRTGQGGEGARQKESNPSTDTSGVKGFEGLKFE